MLTPYQFSSNTPIQAIDLDGLEAYRIIGESQNTFNYYLKKTGADDILVQTGPNNYRISQEAQEASRHSLRIASDATLVIGGIVTTILTGGSATGPYWAAFGVTTGVFSTGVGSAKLALDVQGQYDRSDDIPTTPLGGIGRIVDEFRNNGELTAQSLGDIASGFILLAGSDFKKFDALNNVDKTLTVKGIIDGFASQAEVELSPELRENYASEVLNLIDAETSQGQEED